MKKIQYATPLSAENAVALAKDNGRFLGGGIDLLGELKEYLTETGTLVNVKSLPDSTGILVAADKLILGTNVTVAQIASDPEIAKRLPGLHQAASEVGSPQIRNVATLGGNLAQHSRCWYYRHRDISCLKKGGSVCHAQEGENKYHALFSGNPCISPVVSNLSVILSALEARVFVRRGTEEVAITMPQFYDKAWDNPLFHNSIGPADLILRVEVPLKGVRSSYLQVSEKSSFDWALVSCAAVAVLDGGRVKTARVVLGAVSPVPYQAEAANRFLEGKALDVATVTAAADLLMKDAKPRQHNAYKIPLSKTLIKRTLLALNT